MERAARGLSIEEGILYADPATAVQEIAVWRERAASGHRIGGDPFSAYAAPDGSLPNWPIAAVLNEARMARRFVEEIVGAPYAGLWVAGPNTVCADGDFAEALRLQEGEVVVGAGGTSPPSSPS